MQVRRFFMDTIPDVGDCRSLRTAEAAHAVRVLRLIPGDRLILLDGNGGRAEAEVQRVSRGRADECVCKVISRENICPPELRPVLFVAIPRDRQMGLVLRMAVELGVWRIVPLLSQYGVARPDRDTPKNRWVNELIPAVKQSGNTFIPQLTAPMEIADALAVAPTVGIFGAVPASGTPSAGRSLLSSVSGEIAVWIGPEGGFSEGEEKALIAGGYFAVSVGPNILRIETAVPALLGWLYGVYLP